ncbi:MAG: protein-glutamate O-methyltransferase [Gammaproteobacteria bacterium]|nr:protein-glutamate O-methyltransferase [Gammaproteobacteria bacterium]
MSDASNSPGKEFRFTNEDFTFLSDLVGRNAGINLTEEKRELVYGRVAKRLRVLGIRNFSDYCELLRQDSSDEFTHFINSITTNVTSFFREGHHFDHLANHVLPGIVRKNAGIAHPRLRIWSAGCSTGEEPYSIAMVLRENIRDIDRWDARILATDLDSNVLDIAKRAEYTAGRVQQVAEERKKRWMLMGTGSKSGRIKIRPEVRNMVHFKQLNLTESWPVNGPFDCIFFRNVAIYFKRDTQVSLLNRFADRLDANGTLFVGHAESLIGISNRFVNTGLTIHQKVA